MIATKTKKKAGARATVPQRDGTKTRGSLPGGDGRPKLPPTVKELDALRAEVARAEKAREMVPYGVELIAKAEVKLAEAQGRLATAEVSAMPPATSAVAGLEFAERDVAIAEVFLSGNHRELDDEAETARLARSIGTLNLQQRVGLRQTDVAKYELVWGSRRLAAHRLLGRDTIAAKVYPASLTGADVEILRTVENFGRRELTHVERAIAVARTMDAIERTVAGNQSDGPNAKLKADVDAAGGLHAFVGLQLGYPAKWVQDNAYVSKLGGEARQLLSAHRIDVGHARELAKLGDPGVADEVARMVARSAAGLGGESVARCRQMVTDRLRSLRGTPWRLDVAFGAGVTGCTGQACATCPFNSKADPDLFGGALADEPDAGFCRNEACFAAKTSITAKDVERAAGKAVKLAAKDNGFTPSEAAMQQIVPLHVKPGSAARAAKKEIGAAAGGGGRKSDEPWQRERTPQEKLDESLRNVWTPKAVTAVRKAVVSNSERIVALALLQLFPGFRENPTEAVLMDLADAIAAAVAGDVGLLAKGVADRAAKEAKKDRYQRTVNVPIVDGWPSPVLLEMLAKGWGVKMPPKPTLADFGGGVGDGDPTAAVADAESTGALEDDDEADQGIDAEADENHQGDDDEDPEPTSPTRGSKGKRPSLGNAAAAAKRAKLAGERESAAPALVRDYVQGVAEIDRPLAWRVWNWMTTADAAEPADGDWPAAEGFGRQLTGLARTAGVAVVDGRAFGPAADARRCRECGCTEEDCSQCIIKTGEPCRWVEDDLCSACVPVAADGSTPPAWDFVETFPRPLPAELDNVLANYLADTWDEDLAARVHGELLDDAALVLRQQASAQSAIDGRRDETGNRLNPSGTGHVERELAQLRTYLVDLVDGRPSSVG